MNQFENHNQPKIDPALAEINIHELTKELVESGVAGSEKTPIVEGHDFLGEVEQKFMPTNNEASHNDNHI